MEKILKLIEHYNFNHLPKPSNEEFSSFFNDVVNAYNWKSNFRGGEFSTPKLVSSLMTSLYELPNRSRVFDPFAGKASILTELIRKHKNRVYEIHAVDINPNIVRVGTLNIYVTGLMNFEYTKGNAFEECNKNIDADLIISNPPFGGRIEELTNHNNWQFQHTSDLSLNAIQLALYHLNVNGKALLIMPESFLFGTKKEAVSIRTKLVKENLLHAIISLPKNIFKPYAQVNTALVVVDKSQQSKKSGVFVYDASAVSLDDFNREIKDIVGTFHSESTIRDKARWVTKKEIENNGYDLTTKRYLLQPLENEVDYVLLKDLLDDFFIGNHVSADNINNEEGVPYIQVGDLVEGEGLESISISSLKSFVSDIELVNASLKEIPKGAVLISKVGTKLKPTLFEENYYALASSNIIVLKPGNKVLAEYLVSQLQSKYVQDQIEAIRRYNVIIRQIPCC